MVSFRSSLETRRVERLNRIDGVFAIAVAARSSRSHSNWPAYYRFVRRALAAGNFFCFAFLIVLLGRSGADAAESNSPVASWLAAQKKVATWSADFVQMRTLKTLTQPLTATGRVWFAAPDRFRWELGNPPQTIAVRQPAQMLVIYPHLKRVERYPMTGAANGPWRDALALLEAGFPRGQTEMESKFHLDEQTATNGVTRLRLRPKAPAARRLIPEVRIEFENSDFALRATEMKFADGSVLRNDFTNAHVNLRLDESLFQPTWEDDFKIVEPLQK